MHGSVHDFVVSQTVREWRKLPTGHSGGALIPTILPIEQADFDQKTYPRVLEIGSLDINGSMKTYDFIGSNIPWVEMIGCKEYIGIDLVPGPQVDIVMDGHDLKFPDNSFDLVMCLNTLEHDSDIQKTLKEGYRVLRPGGLYLVQTVDETHPEHMEVHPVELPYNHITEKELAKMVMNVKPKDWNLWHWPPSSDIFVRIEK